VGGRWPDLQRASLAVNVLLALLCAALIYQNRELKSGRAAGPGPAALKPGDRVEGFSYRTLAGETLRLDYSEPGKRSLLFVISTTCPFCQKSLPYIQRLSDASRNGACRILGVSIHDPDLTSRFAAARNLRFRLVSAAGEEFSRQYRITGVPTTILVNGGGVVERVWEGEITERIAAEIARSLAQAPVSSPRADAHRSSSPQKGYGTSTFTPPDVTRTSSPSFTPSLPPSSPQ
jgi:peroxiredoxin